MSACEAHHTRAGSCSRKSRFPRAPRNGAVYIRNGTNCARETVISHNHVLSCTLQYDVSCHLFRINRYTICVRTTKPAREPCTTTTYIILLLSFDARHDFGLRLGQAHCSRRSFWPSSFNPKRGPFSRWSPTAPGTRRIICHNRPIDNNNNTRTSSREFVDPTRIS